MVDEKETSETINLAETSANQTHSNNKLQSIQTEIGEEQRLVISDVLLIQTDSLDIENDYYKANQQIIETNSNGKFYDFHKFI
jgi:hypothetical protein